RSHVQPVSGRCDPRPDDARRPRPPGGNSAADRPLEDEHHRPGACSQFHADPRRPRFDRRRSAAAGHAGPHRHDLLVEPDVTCQMISIKNLVKRYGTFTAVDDVSLDVMPGEIHGFLGPNGAGKTTTIRMIAGLLKPS